MRQTNGEVSIMSVITDHSVDFELRKCWFSEFVGEVVVVLVAYVATFGSDKLCKCENS